MTKRLTRMRIVASATVLVLVGLVAGAVGLVWQQRDKLPDDAVFRYDDRVVTATQLDRRVEVLAALYGVRKPTEEAALARFDRDAAASMAMSMILEKEVARRGIVISEKEVRDELDKLIAAQLTGGQSAFTQFLSANRIAEHDVLDEIERQLATSRLAVKISADVEPATDAAARAAYDSHRDQMRSGEVRRLANIVTTTKADAERVLRLAHRGTKFATLARTWSLDASTRDKGGDLGRLAADQLEPDFAKAAFAAPLHGVFGPVRTQHGWNVGMVKEITAAAPITYRQIKADLKEALEGKAKLDAWNAFLTSLLEGADIQYADRYRPKDPTSLPSGLASSTPADPLLGER